MNNTVVSDPFFIRNLVYGVEDSLISTTGVLVGLDFAGLSIQHVVFAGIVLILVEAMSMSFGALVSEESFFIASNKQYSTFRVFLYAATMFVSYICAGAVVLLPYLLKLPQRNAIAFGTASAGLFLLLLFAQRDPFKAALFTVLGSFILIVTIIVGQNLKKQETKSA